MSVRSSETSPAAEASPPFFVADPELRAAICCPACGGKLSGLEAPIVDGALRCDACGVAYDVRDGIAKLLPPDVDVAHVHDELDHLHGHKHGQAAFFDRGLAEAWEIDRPHGGPSAYGWLMAEKFRRGIERLPSVAGTTALVACCGSGMDAEMLERAGARVVGIDISEGCVRRARERARRYGLRYVAIVGDIERLPLRDASLDLTYVHDGLHHLAEPLHGIDELARVAGAGVSINEPADAVATKIIGRLGASIEFEEAGNRVMRLHAREVERTLRAAGFEPCSRRYLMYYPHTPNWMMHVASLPIMALALRVAMRGGNVPLGRWGNKLNVTGVRRNLTTRSHA